MTLWLATRRAGWCLVVALVLVAVALAFGSVTLSVPSLVSSGLPLPVAAVAPLAVPVVLAWALASSDPLIESGSARALSVLDAAFVASVSCLAAAGIAATAIIGSPETEMAGIAARAVLGYVGLMLLGRALLRHDAAAVVPVAYLIITAFFAGPTSADAPMWGWVIRPPGDPMTWLIAVALFVLGLAVLALDRRVRWADAEA